MTNNMKLKILLLLVPITINLFPIFCCEEGELERESECMNCIDPYGDREMNEFFKPNQTEFSCFEAFEGEETGNEKPGSPRLESYSIKSYIKTRYATTYVTKELTNDQESDIIVTFTILIPTSAYIANFLLIIDNKLEKSIIGKRDKDSGKPPKTGSEFRLFRVTTKLSPNSKVGFYLIYEELLRRKNGQYELNLNVHPERLYDHIDVEVYINENQPLKFVRVPVLKKPGDVAKNNSALQPIVQIKRTTRSTASVKFRPNIEEQKRYIKALKMNQKYGLNVLFRVQYDVERDSSGGEIITNGQYFVHFFSPANLKPLQKHVIFVLDTSGSMANLRIKQLKASMRKILKQLQPDDLFNMIEFGSNVYMDDIEKKKGFKRVVTDKFKDYAHFEKSMKNTKLPVAVKANKANIDEAIKGVDHLKASGFTNIIGGLLTAVLSMKRSQKKYGNKYEPIIIFLTDGDATIGIKNPNEITRLVTDFNHNIASIFSIGLSASSDYSFLEKLSNLNRGEAIFIRNDADISILLEDFFGQVSTPVLSGINFSYGINSTQITKTHFSTLFEGTELVVAGKIGNSKISPKVTAHSDKGSVEYLPYFTHSTTPLDRIWAYLMLHQNIKTLTSSSKPSFDLTQKALNLAAEYSFVTPLTKMSIKLPAGQIDDLKILKPRYKAVSGVQKASITIDNRQIKRRVIPIEIKATVTTPFVQKITAGIKNAFIRVLAKTINDLL